MRDTLSYQYNRRTILAGMGALGATSLIPRKAFAQTRALKIGFISPTTGPLSSFGATDQFVLDTVRAQLKGGIKTAIGTLPVEILAVDTKSSPSIAAAKAAELILEKQVDLMLATSSPDTTNPVADQCELAGVPCITTAAPWEAWYFPRGGTPEKGFTYTYHYFLGLADAIAAYTSIWNRIETNRKVGGLFSNDVDGAVWGDDKVGLPSHLPKLGFELINPGSFTSNTDVFTPQIEAFKKNNVEILTGVINPPDLQTFWTQAREQGLRPKVITMAKALIMPDTVIGLGPDADGMSSEVVWSPFHPFTSSLTGQSASAMAEDWIKKNNKQWTPSLGWTHSLFEIAIDVLKRSADPTDREATTLAVAETDLATIMGPINFKKGPFGRNICITPAVGGQWTVGGPLKVSLDIVANNPLPVVPITAEPRIIDI